MDLPIRIRTTPPAEPVVSVDGAFDAPGLNLSHWPGNRTPAALRHDLSAGIALAFARLDDAEQARLAEGCTAIVNNHYDTDGMAATLAVARPDEALPRAEALLAAAWAGDFFRLPDEDAFRVDAALTALADPERSPIASALAGLGDEARWERAAHEALERLPRWLDGHLEAERELWEEPLARLRADLAALAPAARDDLVHLDATVWTAPADAVAFDPGRHALFGRTTADRVLVLAGDGGGTRARFVLSTKSFFDLVEETAQPRPELAALAARLNELEGGDPGAELAWRHQTRSGASPELWFGRDGLPSFPEHAGEFLATSRLAPTAVKAAVLDALRDALVLPED